VFIYVNVELEELLSNEILDKLIVVDQFLVVNLGSALELHLFGVVLPLNLDLDQCEAYELQHFLGVSHEFHTNVEGV